MVIYDIDFISSPTALPQLLVYRYRSGLLKSRMLAVLQQLGDSAGFPLATVSPDEDIGTGWFAPALFDAGRFYEVSRDTDADRARYRTLKRVLHELPAVPTVIFVRDELFDYGSVRAEGAVIVEEPLIDVQNIRAVLHSLLLCIDFKVPPNVREDPEFKSFLAGWIEERKRATLAELVTLVEQTLLLCVDPVSGAVDFTSIGNDEDDAASSKAMIIRHLDEFLHFPVAEKVAPLLRAISIKNARGWTERALFADLQRATERIIDREFEVTRAAGGATNATRSVSEMLLLWTCLLLVLLHDCETEPASGAETDDHRYVRLVDGLCRKLLGLRRANPDHLIGFWSSFRNSLMSLQRSNDEIAASRFALLDSSLSLALRGDCPDWVTRVRTMKDMLKPQEAVLQEGDVSND